MATVRIYKVAELLNTTSQEVLDLLKKNHGIELKSASSTLEEIVARQFVERQARQRGIELPKGDIFSDQAVKSAKTKSAATKKPGAPVEPPRPAVPTLGPPRLVKKPMLVKPATPVEGAPHVEEPGAHEPDIVEAAPAPPEPVFVEPPVAAEPLPVEVVPEPIAPAAPLHAVEPAAAAEPVPEAPEPPHAPVAPAAPPRPAGRFVPPSIRLRVEEPGQAPPQAPPLVPKRAVVPPQPPRPVAARPRTANVPDAASGWASAALWQPANRGHDPGDDGGTTAAAVAARPPRPARHAGRPGMPPGGPRPQYGQQFRPRPSGATSAPRSAVTRCSGCPLPPPRWRRRRFRAPSRSPRA